MTTLFISDLHLGPNQPHIAEGFFNWLGVQRGKADALYILGDFFDAWIGDDEDHPAAKIIVQHLQEFSATTPTFILKGNRDFLLGEAFAEQAGVKLLPDQTVIDLYGTPTLLLHGDELCTEDQEYMQFRQMVRTPQWQAQILSLPLQQRRQMAAEMREKSQSLNAMKAEDIMDVTPEEVIKTMEKFDVSQMIHGHTHRPAEHDVLLKGNTSGTRWVLGDWHEKGWCISANHTGLTLSHFPL